MAIDSREKRASVLGVARPWMRTKEPGAVDEAWRAATANEYAGNALSPAEGGRVMSSLVAGGGLVGAGGIAGKGGGLVG